MVTIGMRPWSPLGHLLLGRLRVSRRERVEGILVGQGDRRHLVHSRDLGGHLIWSGHLREHLNKYFANSGSPDPRSRHLFPAIHSFGEVLRVELNFRFTSH
jgi:hypothetical protein